MLKILLIGLGGFFGAISRYSIQTLLSNRYPGTFPWGTFVVNIIGCLFIGIIYGLAERHKLMNEEMRLLLAVGFCGSFTTFSAFSAENLNMFELGNYTTMGLYITASILLGLGAVFTGLLLAR
jgi:CrcB protein